MAITLLLRVAGSFLNDTSTVESMDATSQGPVSSETVRLKVRYDRRYPVKWNTPAAAEGFLGHAEKLLELSTSDAVLALMHVWNVGFPGGPEYGPDSPWVGWVKMQEATLRAGEIIRNRLPPLIEACRQRGIPVVHIASSETYATRYLQYDALKREAGPGLPTQNGSPCTDWVKDVTLETFGAGICEHMTVKRTLLDIAPPVRPRTEDFVVTTTHQLNYLLRKLGAWNILYAGFLTNCCLMFSPGGMADMARLGYRILLLRDCTTGWENKESVGTLRATEEAIRTVEQNCWGYTVASADLIAALRPSPLPAGAG